jgi:histidine triad (HIT) family protein
MQQADCVFCNIIKKDIQATVILENDELIVIKDILPKAPVHLLIIPKQHINSITDVGGDHVSLLGNLIVTAKQVADDQGIKDSGYKLVFNVGKDGGQVIEHIHLHLLGGKPLGE